MGNGYAYYLPEEKFSYKIQHLKFKYIFNVNKINVLYCDFHYISYNSTTELAQLEGETPVAYNSKYCSQIAVLLQDFGLMFSILEMLLRNCHQLKSQGEKKCVNKANSLLQMLLPVNKMFFFSGMIENHLYVMP